MEPHFRKHSWRDALNIVRQIDKMIIHSGPDPRSEARIFCSNIDGRVDELVRESERSADKYDACRYTAANWEKRGKGLPDSLRLWLVEHLRGERERPPARGRAGNKTGRRDEVIRLAVSVLIRPKIGFKATRNEATDPEEVCSACDVLAEYFCIKYETVKKAWQSQLRRHS